MFPYLNLFSIKINLYFFWNDFGYLLSLLLPLLFVKEKQNDISFLSYKLYEKISKVKIRGKAVFSDKKQGKWIAVFELIFVAGLLLITDSIGNNIWCKQVVVTNVAANYFGVLILYPIFIYLISMCIGADPIKLADMHAPAYPLALIFYKIGCFCAGCCAGVEWEHGLYNTIHKKHEFPIQLLECFVAVGIFILIFKIRKKVKPGTIFPIYTILYSFTRFFTEFLRIEDNVFGPLKLYQLQCVIGVIVGIAELLFALYFGEKINIYYKKFREWYTSDKVEKVK